MQARLVSLDGQVSVPLNNDINVVGRKEGICDVLLDRGNVSKLHCLITVSYTHLTLPTKA